MLSDRYVAQRIKNERLIGHFLGEDDGVRASRDVEVKWDVHPAGDDCDEWVTGEQRTTLLLLVSGRFRINLSVGSFVLENEGDYAMWGARNRSLLASREGHGGDHRPLAVYF